MGGLSQVLTFLEIAHVFQVPDLYQRNTTWAVPASAPVTNGLLPRRLFSSSRDRNLLMFRLTVRLSGMGGDGLRVRTLPEASSLLPASEGLCVSFLCLLASTSGHRTSAQGHTLGTGVALAASTVWLQ